MRRRAPFIALTQRIAHQYPALDSVEELIRTGSVLVNGTIVTNPRSRVRADAPVTIRTPTPLRGRRKLAPILTAFAVNPRGRIALDVGASTGGFTQALLADGACAVYAVDTGYGQLLGSLRQDPRVRVLERTNLGHLNRQLIPDPIDVVVIDLSYLALAVALPQLEAITFTPNADLIALIKPNYELGLSRTDQEPTATQQALHQVRGALDQLPWRVSGTMPSPLPVAHRAQEAFIHARRNTADT